MLTNHWIRRTKWLTQALIISGTLNIGLIATFAYVVLKEKQQSLAIEQFSPPPKETLPTNTQLLRTYSFLPYQELLLRLENSDLLEEGLTKRDLALACLVAFHHFNLDKALGNLPQKRLIPFPNTDGQTIDVSVFPGLADYQFQAILQYAKTEKWPLTTQGLFFELKRSSPPDPSLLEAFYLTPEFHSLYTHLTKTGLTTSPEQVVALICEGNSLPSQDHQSTLLNYLNNHSKLAAKFLLDSDPDFALKRLDDTQVLTLLDLYPEKTPTLETFAKELVASPRTDAVRTRAATFVTIQTTIPLPIPTKKKMHTIEVGDNLWKIARKYHVTIDDIKRINNLETEKLRPGKQLEIPEKK